MKSKLQEWLVQTRICANYEIGVTCMEQTLPNTAYVAMWPMKDGRYCVVAKFRILPN